MLEPQEGTRKPCVIWKILVGEEQISFKDPNGKHMNCTFCGRVNMRRPFDLYLWFDHRNTQRHQNAMLDAISEKERILKATKYGENDQL